MLLLLLALQDPVTTERLLDEMTDLERLTRPAAYATRMFSSHERSADPYANDDRGRYLRKDVDGWVLAESEGSGCIVRIWSANPSGTIRIRLDGTPVYDGDFEALMSGTVDPFVEPFAGVRARGANLYFPLPYRRSMKITATAGDLYYHVTVRRYLPEVAVETFDPARLPREAIRRTAGRLLDPDATVPPSRRVPIGTTLEGPGTIVRLEVKAPPDRLRAAVIRMTFDGGECVWCPLIDFFGTAPEASPHSAWPLSVTKEGLLICRFPMPFDRSARIDVEGAEVEGSAWVRQGACGPYRFHAGWRGSVRLPTRPRSDWPVLHGEGAGRYVGTTLVVRNPVRAWWGEGDERIRIDGEPEPSLSGTGTEDYFGFAWCDTALISHAYHGQTRCDGPANRGWTALHRFHILDDIPFSKSIRFDLEIAHWRSVDLVLSTVAYGYADPVFRHDFKPVGALERIPPELPVLVSVRGAIEGESMTALSTPAGRVGPQDMPGLDWSGGEQLWWRAAKPGDALVLAFDSALSGKRMLSLALTHSPEYGIFRLSLNDAPLGEVDLYAQTPVVVTHRFESELRSGANELRVEIAGSNDLADPKAFHFGLDYLRIGE